MARLADIVFDARHPASIARFWAYAVDGYEVAPYDDAELERLRARGINDPEDDDGVVVESAELPVRLYFQLVPEGKTVKNRVHLDLRVADVDAEVDRLLAAGATELWRVDGRVTLADPDGNEFCIDQA